MQRQVNSPTRGRERDLRPLLQEFWLANGSVSSLVLKGGDRKSASLMSHLCVGDTEKSLEYLGSCVLLVWSRPCLPNWVLERWVGLWSQPQSVGWGAAHGCFGGRWLGWGVRYQSLAYWAHGMSRLLLLACCKVSESSVESTFHQNRGDGAAATP